MVNENGGFVVIEGMEWANSYDLWYDRYRDKFKDKSVPQCSSEEVCEIIQEFLDNEHPFPHEKLNWIQKLFHKHKWIRYTQVASAKKKLICKCGCTRDITTHLDEWCRQYEIY